MTYRKYRNRPPQNPDARITWGEQAPRGENAQPQSKGGVAGIQKYEKAEGLFFPALEPVFTRKVDFVRKNYAPCGSTPENQDRFLEVTCDDGSALIVDTREGSLDYSKVPYTFNPLLVFA